MERAYLFDAYGTLLDVHAAVRRHAAAIGPDFLAFSELWRAKQLEYTWVRTLMGAYADFRQLTQDGLDYALARFPAVDPGLRPRLLDAYLRLDCHPEVPDVLRELKAGGARLGVLSNGTPEMLRGAVASAGLEGVVEDLFSVHDTGHFKTHPLAYTVYRDAWQLPADEIVFVSSNRWDIAGANKAGFRTVWLNRAGLPDEYPDLPPWRTIGAMTELLTA